MRNNATRLTLGSAPNAVARPASADTTSRPPTMLRARPTVSTGVSASRSAATGGVRAALNAGSSADRTVTTIARTTAVTHRLRR